MLTLPDFREKQILFIQADNKTKNKIRFENDNIVFEKDEIVVNRASCHKVFAIFVMGDMTLTTGILREGAKLGVSFFFMKTNFNSYVAVGSLAQGNYLLRSTQYKMSEEQEIKMSKILVANKIKNQGKLLEKIGDGGEIFKNINALGKLTLTATDGNALLGIEGNVSRVFFSGYFKDLKWSRRTPRTRQDIPNFLMDIGYTLLFNFIDALLNVYGFDTYKGVYHKLFFQRKSLSCDVVEPFRCLIDRQILKSFNLKQINEKDFKVIKGKYELDYLSSQKYSRIFMEAIMERKEDIFLFVQGFYRHFMNNEKYSFPTFDI